MAGEPEGTTPPAAGNEDTNAAKPAEQQRTDDPFDGATKGIKDRLTRLESRIMKETVKPLEAKIAELEARLAGQAEKPAEGQEQKQEAEAAQPQNTVEFLRLKAAYEAGLPQEALPLITASDDDGIKAQVTAIQALQPVGRRLRSPIPASDANGQPKQSYTRSQLRDGKFYAEHSADIMLAAAEGRIIED